MDFKVEQRVRLLNKPDPAWFDPSMLPPQQNFLAMPLDKLFLRKVAAKKLRIGGNGSIGEIVAIDKNTRTLHIKFKDVELDNVPFDCCVVVPAHKMAEESIDAEESPLVEPVDD